MRVEAKLEELGLVLPEPAKLPPGVQASFAWVRAYGDRIYVSGHGPFAPDGTPSGPFGKVGEDVSPSKGTRPPARRPWRSSAASGASWATSTA